jgi:hypothetical protein
MHAPYFAALTAGLLLLGGCTQHAAPGPTGSSANQAAAPAQTAAAPTASRRPAAVAATPTASSPPFTTAPWLAIVVSGAPTTYAAPAIAATPVARLTPGVPYPVLGRTAGLVRASWCEVVVNGTPSWMGCSFGTSALYFLKGTADTLPIVAPAAPTPPANYRPPPVSVATPPGAASPAAVLRSAAVERLLQQCRVTYFVAGPHAPGGGEVLLSDGTHDVLPPDLPVGGGSPVEALLKSNERRCGFAVIWAVA